MQFCTGNFAKLQCSTTRGDAVMARRNRDAQMRRALQAMQTLIALRQVVRRQCAPLMAAQMDMWLRIIGARIVEVMRRVEGV